MGGYIISFGLLSVFLLLTWHTFIVCLIMNWALRITYFKHLSISRQATATILILQVEKPKPRKAT